MVIKKKTALVIDDDPDFCYLVKTILEAKGMLTSDCSTLAEARSFLEKEIPNVILLDMQLQGETGTDFLKERGRNPLWLKIPVVVCSSQNLAMTVKEAIRFGADDYLLKPIKQTWLIQRIRKNLIKEDHLAYFFNEDEEVDLLSEVRPISVSEANFVGRGSVGFDRAAIVLASIPQADNEAPIVTNFKTEEKSVYSSDGPFDTIFLNVAVTEAEKNRVQLLKSFWRF